MSSTQTKPSRGYVECSHVCCFAIIIGVEGDLCEDCKVADPEHDHNDCEACDNDSVPCDETAHFRSEG